MPAEGIYLYGISGTLYLVVSQNKGTPKKTTNTIVLVMGTPKKVPLILGDPHLEAYPHKRLRKEVVGANWSPASGVQGALPKAAFGLPQGPPWPKRLFPGLCISHHGTPLRVASSTLTSRTGSFETFKNCPNCHAGLLLGHNSRPVASNDGRYGHQPQLSQGKDRLLSLHTGARNLG